MRHSVGKPLADDAFERPRGALIIVYAELHAVTIAEVSVTEAASLGLLRDPANDAAAYAAENIEGGMVKFRQSGQLR